MKPRSLLAQVLAVNLLLVASTALLATVVVDAHFTSLTRGREWVVFSLAVLATLLWNWLLLRRWFEPIDRVISAMEHTNLADPRGAATAPPQTGSAEVRRLDAAFQRMIARLGAERREAGRAAIRAQERERQRIAQDLHDEVNQALTAVSLRLQAAREIRSHLPGARVLIVSMHDDERYLFEALKAGASGYVTQARGRPGPRRRRQSGRPRRGVLDQRRRALAGQTVDGRGV